MNFIGGFKCNVQSGTYFNVCLRMMFVTRLSIICIVKRFFFTIKLDVRKRNVICRIKNLIQFYIFVILLIGCNLQVSSDERTTVDWPPFGVHDKLKIGWIQSHSYGTSLNYTTKMLASRISLFLTFISQQLGISANAGLILIIITNCCHEMVAYQFY